VKGEASAVDQGDMVRIGHQVFFLDKIFCVKDSGSILWIYFAGLGNDPAQLTGNFRDSMLSAINDRMDFVRIGEYIIPLSQINYMTDLNEELAIFTPRPQPIKATGHIREQIYKRLGLDVPVPPPPIYIRP
jgi:hypothetical protein